MASSQVEFAQTSPFGCVLRDHNSRRDRRRDPNPNLNPNPNPSPKSQSSFQRNFKDLVRDHLQSCISISPRASNHEPDENSDQPCGGFSCFGGNSSKTTTTMTTNHHNNRWAAQKAKEIGNTVETQTQTQTRTRTLKNERRDPSPARSDSSNSDFSVSSLVQKWRGFEAEAEARHNHSTPTATAVANDSDISRDSSLVSTTESTVTSATTVDEGGEREEVAVKERETEEEEREREKERERERERIRVADIVRKWPGDEQGVVCLARLRIGKDSKGDGETRTFSPCLVSPRIRGRQAIADLFMSMERERYKEVELLESRHAVSKFPQRGRIQSLLKLRFLRRELTVEEQQRPPLPSGVVGSSRCQTSSAITCLREKFKTSADQDSINQKSACKETPNSSNQETQNASTSKHTSEQGSCQHEPNIRSSLAEAKKSDQETESAATSKQPINQASDQEHLNIGSSLITKTMDNNEEEKTISTLNQPSKQIICDEELNIASHLNNKEATERVLTSNQDSEQRFVSHCEQSNAVKTEQCIREEEEVSHQNPVIEVVQEETPSSEVTCQESSCEEDGVNIAKTQDMGETAALYNDWEQEEDEEIVYEDHEESSQYYFEPNLDWISDIARPRSYWEDLRKTWYQEVFNTRSQDEEIRQLLERGSVSAVLASDFRDRMDRLVMNSVQRAMHSSIEEQEEDRSMRAFFEQHLSSFNYVQERREEERQVQEQVQEHIEYDRQEQNRRQLLERGNVSAVLASDFRERMDQLVLNHMQRAMSSSVVQEQDEDRSRREESTEDVEQEQNMVEDEQENGELEDETEDESSTMHQYHDVSDYYDQNSSSSHLNWDHHDHEGSYDSDHAASTSLQEPSPLTSYGRATHEGSSFKNASIEMELIYDLRSHMEQLYREMAELRKSITSCMDMQMKMQHTIREEVSAAIIRKDSNPKMADRVERKESNRKKPKKGTCCICYEKKVDSLLYRCGHMCTCFTCANELQWSSGKCPICRAQIIDVVRAYPQS